ncbi:MAG: RNA methyltransferase [Candidatus Eremiobacteraeota bacterium]|nr:RNA methyltransferase [Candidatus Eremiobacteraeota bacterium]
MPTTLGAHSPRLAAVRALLTKRGRREQGCFSVAGLTMLEEALSAQRVPEALYVTAAALDALGPPTATLADRIFVVSERALAGLTDLETPPGLVAVHRGSLENAEAILASGAPTLVLADLSDPGNAGTLLRSAEIFGIKAALLTERAVGPYNPKLVRATMGAIFRLRLGVGGGAELRAAAAGFGYAVVVADRSGSPLPRFRFPRKPLIVIGNERHGPGDWLRHAEHCVAIPQGGRGQSLNAAVAGAIILYAFQQQCADTIGSS